MKKVLTIQSFQLSHVRIEKSIEDAKSLSLLGFLDPSIAAEKVRNIGKNLLKYPRISRYFFLAM